MNDSSEIENQLRKLQPIRPSVNLVERIERSLVETPSTSTAGVIPHERRRLHSNWLSLGLGFAAAAALLLFARVNFDHPLKEVPTVASMTPATTLPPANMSSGFVPAGLTQVVYHTRDEGLHFPDASGQPMRRVRSQRRETLRWRNPNTGASLCVSYPTEEVELVPISGQ